MEDFIFDTEEDLNKGRKYYVLVIYDITDNKRRSKLVKIAKSFGFRVQKSAFEARLSQNKYNSMLVQLYDIVKEDDSVRIYKLRGSGVVTVIGKDDTVDEEEVIII